MSGIYRFRALIQVLMKLCLMLMLPVPGAPPRKVQVEAVNSTALRVSWKSPLTLKHHGQIQGYQLVCARLHNGEPHGQPFIMDISLPDAEVLQRSPAKSSY